MSAGVTETDRVRFAPGVVLRHDGTRAAWVLLAPERVMVLDEIALAVVRACIQADRSVGLGIDELVQAFDAPRADIANDVLDVLTTLRDRGFIAR